MNGEPFAPCNSPRGAVAAKPIKGMTTLRLATLRYLENESGATRPSPVHFHGSAFAAARWLYENDFAGMVGRGFYPLKSRPSTHETGVL